MRKSPIQLWERDRGHRGLRELPAAARVRARGEACLRVRPGQCAGCRGGGWLGGLEAVVVAQAAELERVGTLGVAPGAPSPLWGAYRVTADVSCRGVEEGWAVSELAEARVAPVAEESPYAASAALDARAAFVVMVDVAVAFELVAADAAAAALGCPDVGEGEFGESVSVRAMVGGSAVLLDGAHPVLVVGSAPPAARAVLDDVDRPADRADALASVCVDLGEPVLFSPARDC